MESRCQSFLAGMRRIAPILLGVIPFGAIFGVAAMDRGLTPESAQTMSIVVFAGAAQLAAVDLLGRDSALLVVVLTALVINLRFTMYSASLSPHFLGLPRRIKLALAYLLTDQAYAVSILRFDEEEDPAGKVWFYLGAATPLWCIWQLSTGAGIFLGTRVPESWSLDFAVPLTFLALLVPAIRDRATTLAAITAGIIAVAATALPCNLGLVLATVVGIGAGVLVEGRRRDA